MPRGGTIDSSKTSKIFNYDHLRNINSEESQKHFNEEWNWCREFAEMQRRGLCYVPAIKQKSRVWDYKTACEFLFEDKLDFD